MSSRVIALLSLAMAVLAGCQPPPRPFQPDTKVGALQAFAVPGPRTVMVVRPVAGLPADLATRLSARVAKALQAFEIGATSQDTAAPRYRLVGTIESTERSGAFVIVSLDWRMRDPQGGEMGSFRQVEAVAGRDWNLATDEALDVIAKRIAPRIDTLIRGDSAPAAPIAQVAIPAVAGASGDGPLALSAAMAEALRSRNIAIGRPGTGGTYLVEGKVGIGPGPGGYDMVRIAWRVVHPDGRPLGNVGQENAVPKGSLDIAWGPVARAVAEQAADGIVQILRTVQGLGPSGPGS